METGTWSRPSCKRWFHTSGIPFITSRFDTLWRRENERENKNAPCFEKDGNSGRGERERERERENNPTADSCGNVELCISHHSNKNHPGNIDPAQNADDSILASCVRANEQNVAPTHIPTIISDMVMARGRKKEGGKAPTDPMESGKYD